jgi:hypothetical protein
LLFPAFFIGAVIGIASAAEPAHFSYIPPPPGKMVESRLVALSGAGTQGRWRAVLSRKVVGREGDQRFYQWYLTLYAPNAAGDYVQKYRAPGNGTSSLLTVVEKARGANLWFPVQTVKIVGSAELMQPGVQQLVVAVHESGADCGAATVTILRYDQASGKIAPAVSVRTGCRLDAGIVRTSSGDALRLNGPYYGPEAPLCCPTKPKASALLRYRAGRWIQSPAYYEMSVGTYAFSR